MTTERLYEFLVLAQTLSYTRAAKMLFMTQSTLSRHIAEMEAELGARLLERSTHAVRLTPAGRSLARRSGPLIRKSERAVRKLRFSEAATRGTVSVCCLETAVYDQLMLFLTSFCAKFRDVDVRIDALGEAERADAMERYDFIFTASEPRNLPERFQAGIAFRSPGVLSVLAEHPLISNHRVDLAQLAGETLFAPYADDLFSSYSVNRQLAEKLTNYRVNVVRVPTAESALMRVALGKGVAIVPQHISRSSLNHVWTVDISTPGCVFDTYYYWNRSRPNPAADLMAEELEAQAKALLTG